MNGKKAFLFKLFPLLDLALILLCVWVAPYIADHVLAEPLGWSKNPQYQLLSVAPYLGGAVIVLAPFVLHLVGFYRKQSLQRVSTALRQIALAGAYYLCVLALYQTISPLSEATNHVVLVSIVLVAVTLFLRFLATRWMRLCMSSSPASRIPVLLIGQDEDVIEKGWASLPRFWKGTLHVVGHVQPDTPIAEVQSLIEQHHVQQCLLIGGIGAYHNNADLLMLCEVQGIDVYIHLREEQPVTLRAEVTEIGEQRLLILTSTPVYSWSRLVKTIIDRLLALVLLVCSSPFWLLAAVGIKISDPKGPIFYRQMRSGLYGKPFAIWKFRSMYTDADKRLDEVKAKYGNEMSGPIFKLTNDPRIFPFGHFIRKFSIDELPQLINILKGDMSIVGPRPLPVYETAEFPDVAHRRRLSVRPGLTCFWQIEDRSDNGDFENMIRKDLKYIDNWSLWLDIKLFLRTIPAVLFGKGAK